MTVPDDPKRRWRLGLAASVVVGLIVLLVWWVRTPDRAADRVTETGDPLRTHVQPRSSRSPAPAAPSAAPVPTIQCAVSLSDGPLRFVALERFAPVARQITVSHGLLEAVVDVPDGEGDLVRDGVQLGRLVWGEPDGEPWCEVRPVPVEPLTGQVIDGAGEPVADATVTGCGVSTTTDSSGSFSLDVPAHRVCRVRAAAFEPVAATSEVVWVEAPGPVELELRERGPAELSSELASAVSVMESLEQVNEQLRAIAPNPVLDEEIARARERLPAIREAMSSEDPDVLLDVWLSLQ